MAYDKLEIISPHIRPHRSTHFKHSILLNNASNSIVFFGDACCHFTISLPYDFKCSSFFLSSLPLMTTFDYFPHYVYVCVELALELHRSVDLSSLIDRAIIFLLSTFFFCCRWVEGVFHVYFDWTHLFRPVLFVSLVYRCQTFLWIFTYFDFIIIRNDFHFLQNLSTRKSYLKAFARVRKSKHLQAYWN